MKQSKQHSKAFRSEKEDSQTSVSGADAERAPIGFSKARAGFREIGGQVTGYYRYLPGNRAEVMAHFQHREQIAKLCQRLQLRLEAEFDLASLKNDERRKRARRVGPDAAKNAGTRTTADAAQLDLLEATLVAFSGDPEHAKAAPADGNPTHAAGTPEAAGAPTAGSEVAALETAQTGRGEIAADAESIPGPADRQSETGAAPGPGAKTKTKAKTNENRKADRAPRTLEESLSGIRPLGPASLNDAEQRANQAKRGGRKKRNASA